MYNPDYLNWGQQGWICPQCHKTFAPHVSECPYCNAERKTFATTKINITPFDDAGWWDDYMKRTSADGEWWERYLREFQTGKPVNDNPSTTTATTNTDQNVKVTAWNDMETGHVEIGKDGSISWKGPTPEIHYSTNTGLNVAPCNECMTDWLEAFNEQFK